MDMLDRVGQKGRNKNSPRRMGLFQPQRRKAETLLLAWLSASLKSSPSTYIAPVSSGLRPPWSKAHMRPDFEHPDWYNGFEHDPEEAARVRVRLLRELAATGEALVDSPVVPVRLPCGGRRGGLSLGTGLPGLLTTFRRGPR